MRCRISDVRRLFFAALFCSVVLAAVLPAFSDAPGESQQHLLQDIKYLASDDLEGRGIGTKGLDLAAAYIRDQFAKAGLNVASVKGDAFQKFEMTTGSSLGTPNSLDLSGPESRRINLKLETDFIPFSFGGTGPFEGELVFCGYAIEDADKKYNDFAGIDLKGKVAIVMRRVPQQGTANGPFAGPHGGISSHGELVTKVSNAFGKGAIAVLFVNDPFSGRADLDEVKKRLDKAALGVAAVAEELDGTDPADAEKTAAVRKKLSAELVRYKGVKAEVGLGEPDKLMKFGYGGDDSLRSIPVLQITRAACNEMLKASLNKTLADLEKAIDKDLKPHSALLKGWTVKGVTSIERQKSEVKNVIGVLDGEGPLAQETIIIGAHYDHVGRGGKSSLAPGSNEIHNGADDNASGTVSLIELARRFGARKEKLPRRLVFIAFTGEESGLIGSARYVKEPLFPLEKTIAMFNMDMVGRLSEEKLTIFGTGTSPVWAGMIERLAKEHGFHVISKPEGFGPSDHSSFYAKQIPVLHFFTGNHNDYHRPTDDWEKINVPGMARVVEVLQKMAVEVAQTPEPPKYVAIKTMASLGRSGNRPYFGSIPDFSTDMPGYALSGVAPGSPAEKGGLKAGDVIVQIGMQKIDNLDDFDLALRRFSAGDIADVTVMRGKDKLVLKVTLDKPRG